MKAHYEKKGYFLIKNALCREEVRLLIKELSIFETQRNHYGIRNLMNKVPYISQLAKSKLLLTLAQSILGSSAKPVRSVFFDKTKEANWNVAWHQDTSIAVKAQVNREGFKLWSIKQGVVYVEPPIEYLANLLTLRIHLDPANPETGGLRVIASTHNQGRINSKQLIERVEKSTVIDCNANRGDILLMNPLLFHSSRKATQPLHRRIIHLEYSAMELPKSLEWFENTSKT